MKEGEDDFKKIAIKTPVLKEMSYSVYAENLESTLKLISNSKNICLCDKKDLKSKRTFITS